MERFGDLQIEEDIRFQEREWTAQRVGWVLLLAFVMVAALGLFGHGPISWTTAASADGTVQASFERFGRRGGTQSLVVRADASTATAGHWHLEVTGNYVEDLQVTAISPQPDSVDLLPDGLRYVFDQAEPGADLDVTFSITPDTLWGTSGTVHVASRDIEIEQFFFP